MIPMRRPQPCLTFPSTRTSPPSDLASCSGSAGKLPWVRPIRAVGRPGLNGGARQPGSDGCHQSRPPRDHVDDARQVRAHGGEPTIPGGLAGSSPRCYH